MADDKKVKVSLSAQHIADLDQQLVKATQGSQSSAAPAAHPSGYKGYIEVPPGSEAAAQQATINASPEAAAALHDALQKFVESDASFSTAVKHSNMVPLAVPTQAGKSTESK